MPSSLARARSRAPAAVTALVALLAIAGLAGAYHLSAGATDAPTADRRLPARPPSGR